MTKIAQLKNRVLIQLNGHDCTSFLENLLSCGVSTLNDGEMKYGALLTPQGKLIADMLVTTKDGAVWLEVSETKKDELIQKFNLYKLRAEVEINEDNRNVFVAWGNGEGSVDGINDPRHNELGSRIYANQVETNATQEEWEQHRIQLGIPDPSSDFFGCNLYPHDIMMDKLNGIDMTKGCYVGQEVVSRMEHKGNVKRRIFLVVEGEALKPGEITSSGRSVGTMGQPINQVALAILRIDRIGEVGENQKIQTDQGILRIRTPDYA